jgi:predicted phosphoribosyltransferase
VAEFLLVDADLEPLFADRSEAGRELGSLLAHRRREAPETVVGLARGGVAVAAEVARALDVPLDVIAVRKVGHPLQPEYALGAVTPDAVYIRAHDGLTADEVAELVARAKAEAGTLDQRLHAVDGPIDLTATTAIVVDDGLATGATMIAALRSARTAGARHVVAAVPVAPAATLTLIESEADEVVCPHVPPTFMGVGLWYRSFGQLTDTDVIRLLEGSRRGSGAVETAKGGMTRSPGRPGGASPSVWTPGPPARC